MHKQMNTKRIFAILALAFCSAIAFAQKDANAKKVLDATAAKLKAMKSVKTNFEVTNFIGLSEQGTSTGTILLSGDKYHVDTPDLKTWFDGSTQWTYISDTDEVNVSTPSKEEQAQSNPYAFVGLYRSGYNYTMTKTTLHGKQVYEIRLTAESKANDIQEARINVSTDYIPVSVRIRQGKNNWTRIRINGLSKQKFDASTFKFDQTKYPDAEIIDLR